MTMNINRQMNKNYNHKRIYRLMEELKISSMIRRKRNILRIPGNMMWKIY